MKTEILLQLKNLSVRYGGVTALDCVDLFIEEGEIVALMGPNGAGKSTILKALFGLVPIQSGQVYWHEQSFIPISYEAVERGIAFVPQGRRVFSSLTVRENLEVGGYINHDTKLTKSRVNEVLELFPILKKKINQKSGTLSGGQQQMLAIARGLMTDPKVLLLDEPSLGLAPKIVKEVFNLIKEINQKRNTAIIVVEHNINSLLTIATRGYILDKGKVLAHGNPQELVAKGTLEKAFMGSSKDIIGGEK